MVHFDVQHEATKYIFQCTYIDLFRMRERFPRLVLKIQITHIAREIVPYVLFSHDIQRFMHIELFKNESSFFVWIINTSIKQ